MEPVKGIDTSDAVNPGSVGSPTVTQASVLGLLVVVTVAKALSDRLDWRHYQAKLNTTDRNVKILGTAMLVITTIVLEALRVISGLGSPLSILSYATIAVLSFGVGAVGKHCYDLSTMLKIERQRLI